MQQIRPKTLCKCHVEYRQDTWCQKYCSRANDKSKDPKKAKMEYADVTPYIPRESRIKPRRIKCLDDGTEYESAKELAELLDVTDSAVCNCCRGRTITLKGKQYSYIGYQARGMIEQQNLTRTPVKKRRPSIPVKDRKTGAIYESCREVAESIGCGITTIYRQLTMDYTDPSKRFEYVDVE